MINTHSSFICKFRADVEEKKTKVFIDTSIRQRNHPKDPYFVKI